MYDFSPQVWSLFSMLKYSTIQGGGIWETTEFHEYWTRQYVLHVVSVFCLISFYGFQYGCWFFSVIERNLKFWYRNLLFSVLYALTLTLRLRWCFYAGVCNENYRKSNVMMAKKLGGSISSFFWISFFKNWGCCNGVFEVLIQDSDREWS